MMVLCLCPPLDIDVPISSSNVGPPRLWDSQGNDHSAAIRGAAEFVSWIDECKQEWFSKHPLQTPPKKGKRRVKKAAEKPKKKSKKSKNEYPITEALLREEVARINAELQGMGTRRVFMENRDGKKVEVEVPRGEPYAHKDSEKLKLFYQDVVKDATGKPGQKRIHYAKLRAVGAEIVGEGRDLKMVPVLAVNWVDMVEQKGKMGDHQKNYKVATSALLDMVAAFTNAQKVRTSKHPERVQTVSASDIKGEGPFRSPRPFQQLVKVDKHGKLTKETLSERFPIRLRYAKVVSEEEYEQYLARKRRKEAESEGEEESEDDSNASHAAAPVYYGDTDYEEHVSKGKWRETDESDKSSSSEYESDQRVDPVTGFAVKPKSSKKQVSKTSKRKVTQTVQMSNSDDEETITNRKPQKKEINAAERQKYQRKCTMLWNKTGKERYRRWLFEQIKSIVERDQ